MATIALLGQGVVLARAPRTDTSPFVFWQVPDVLSIRGPTSRAPEVKVTSHSSPLGSDEFIAGNRDPGEMQFQVNFNPSNNNHKDYDGTAVSALTPDGLAYMFRTGGTYQWKLTVVQTSPDTTSRFAASIIGMEYAFPTDAQITADMTLRLSGSVVWA